jgi:predicted nucleic acid-binding protein
LSVFIDTGIFVAVRNAADKDHRRGKELMRRKGEFGAAYTSDYVIDEAITTALTRTKRLELAIDIGEFILSSPRIIKLRVSEDAFNAAWELFKSLKERFLSFTDCTSLALMEKNGIERIASFDSGFDGLVERIG